MLTSLYAVLRTLYAVLISLYAVLRTLYAVLTSLYAVLSSLYAVHTSLYAVLSSLYAVHTSLYAVHTSLYAVLTSLYAVHTSLYAVLSSLYAVLTTLYAVLISLYVKTFATTLLYDAQSSHVPEPAILLASAYELLTVKWELFSQVMSITLRSTNSTQPNPDDGVLRDSSACKDVRLVSKTWREKRWKSDVLIFSLDFLLR